MTDDLKQAAREALEPFSGGQYAANRNPDIADHETVLLHTTVGDLRRARSVYDRLASTASPAGESVTAVVKALEWEHHRDAPGNARAPSDFGTYRLRANGEGVMWGCRIDGPFMNNKAPSMREAKAAAQADFERRVLACLTTPVSADAEGGTALETGEILANYARGNINADDTIFALVEGIKDYALTSAQESSASPGGDGKERGR